MLPFRSLQNFFIPSLPLLCFFFSVVKCTFHKNWITWDMFPFVIENVLDDFYMYGFFKQIFSIYVKNKWFFVRFLILIVLWYFTMFFGPFSISMILIWHTFLCDSTLCFVRNEWKQFKPLMSPLFLHYISVLNNADSNFTSR